MGLSSPIVVLFLICCSKDSLSSGELHTPGELLAHKMSATLWVQQDGMDSTVEADNCPPPGCQTAGRQLGERPGLTKYYRTHPWCQIHCRNHQGADTAAVSGTLESGIGHECSEWYLQ